MDKRPTKDIVVTKSNGSLPPVDTLHRAVHKIRSSALCHNYSEVESAANRQRCSVIVVVKADGYGHGAIATALYLADHMGADAFAVATLEEGIALRKTFQQTAASAHVPKNQNHMSSLFQNRAGADDATSMTSLTASMTVMNANGGQGQRRNMRPSQIRILVLGPPVGFPRCFDDYYHHNIEVMISGPEVAKALLVWVCNTGERKRTQVERAAAEAKEMALKGHPPPPPRTAPASLFEHKESNGSEGSTGENSQDSNSNPRYHAPSATLGNVTGSDLAKEVREILKNQMLAAENKHQQQAQKKHTPTHTHTHTSGTSTPQTVISSLTPDPSVADLTTHPPTASTSATATGTNTNTVTTQVFAGIEEAAKKSRTRQKAMTSEVFCDNGDDEEGEGGDPSATNKPNTPTNTNRKAMPMPKVVPRKRLRWHALVDSGMGRLGFRTGPVSKEEHGKRRDSVEILKELVDLEFALDCPIEFFGMCTHMADANSTSDYTNSQITKFKSLLKRVRAAGISVPTLSTDNSAALLTTNLMHFDPNELLSADTRGYVRIGGAIYGQRPSFPQLKAVSTLFAWVRHVATLKKGESVGYDRAYIAPRNVRIATLTVGFADGYPRELGNGVGKVSIRGHLFPVTGNVCMDMLMVELGPAEEKDSPGAQVVVGDTVILWGPGNDEDEGLVRLQDIAAALKTTQSALTCGLDKERVLRQY
jgi:alanine racemase